MAWSFGGASGVWRVIVSLFRSHSASRFMVEVNIGDLAAGKMTTKKCVLRRYETDKYGTRGILTLPSGSQFYVLEPSPKAKNPCIPVGAYVCEWTTKPKHGECYEVKDVPGRTAVLLHSGNFGGDTFHGLKTDTEGCLLPGRAIGEIGNQLAVLSSRDALRAIVDELEKESFHLTIEWSREVPREAYL